MSKQSSLRLIYNLVLIVIVVISVVATGLISINGYKANKVPEMCSEKQIIKQVKENYSDFEFEENDSWSVYTVLGEGNKSFSANVDIIKTKELCKKYYVVQLLYELNDGKWNVDNLPEEISFVKKEWLFENSIWSSSTDDGITYKVSFISDLEAEISMEGNPNDSSDEDDLVNSLTFNSEDDYDHNGDSEDDEKAEDNKVIDSKSDNDDESVINTEDFVQTASCQLMESTDGQSFDGVFELADKSVSLIITEESMKLVLGQKEGELILKRDDSISIS